MIIFVSFLVGNTKLPLHIGGITSTLSRGSSISSSLDKSKGGREGLFLFSISYLGRSKGVCSKGRLQAGDRENESSPFPSKEFFEKDQRSGTGD